MLQIETGETEERPNRTKTAPKQTEKRGQRAGGKRDTRKGSQFVGDRAGRHSGRERKGDVYAH